MTEIDSPAIPGIANYWYSNSGQARKAALRYATSLGPGYAIIPHRAHAPGQLPHYHIVTPAGRHLRLHFFFGRKPPIKASRGGRPIREVDGEGDYDTELDQFLGSVWGWFSPSSTSTTVAVIPRSGWGARAPKCSQALRVPVGYAFIHHTAGSKPTSESQERAAMQQIQRYHQDKRGWCDIAYNFLIMPSGRVYEGRGWTRANGATKGYNSNSLAFCFAGNFETATPTAAAISACRALMAQGVHDGYLTSGFTLRGHRDVGSTACPGRNLYARLPDLYP